MEMAVAAVKLMAACRILLIICAQVRDQKKESVQASNGEAYHLVRLHKDVLPSSEPLAWEVVPRWRLDPSCIVGWWGDCGVQILWLSVDDTPGNIFARRQLILGFIVLVAWIKRGDEMMNGHMWLVLSRSYYDSFRPRSYFCLLYRDSVQ